MFFISKGNVAILDDERDTLAVLGEGSFFGETSLLCAPKCDSELDFATLSLDLSLICWKYPKISQLKAPAQNVNIIAATNVRLPIAQVKFQTRLCPWRQPLLR